MSYQDTRSTDEGRNSIYVSVLDRTTAAERERAKLFSKKMRLAAEEQGFRWGSCYLEYTKHNIRLKLWCVDWSQDRGAHDALTKEEALSNIEGMLVCRYGDYTIQFHRYAPLPNDYIIKSIVATIKRR